MSNRQAQKERRRKEREERLQTEQQTEQRKKLAQIAGGGAVVAAMIGGIVLAASGGGASTAGESAGTAPARLPIPPQRQTDLRRATADAGCAFREFESEGQDHVEDEVTPADFKTNPPTSGKHNPVWAQDGFYAPGNEPALKNSVHALEHGRVQIQYRPTLPLRQQRQLRALFNEDAAGGGEGYHMLMLGLLHDLVTGWVTRPEGPVWS